MFAYGLSGITTDVQWKKRVVKTVLVFFLTSFQFCFHNNFQTRASNRRSNPELTHCTGPSVAPYSDI